VGVSRLVVVQDQVTGRAIIQSAPDGENSIVLHKGANFYGGPTAAVTSDDLDTYTHLILQNEIPLDSTLSYLTSSVSHGITSVFNPSPMLTEEELVAFPWAALSWLIVNDGELSDLLVAFGVQVQGEDTLRQTAEAGIAALRKLQGFGKVGVIVTLGSQGIVYSHPEAGSGYMPAGKLVTPVKDTTGAGDCFAGYFTAGLMAGLKLEDVLWVCLIVSLIFWYLSQTRS
jgi:ribokinase